MASADAAEKALREGDPAAALEALQVRIRAKPADPALRIFLFQLLCVLGSWDRALDQLNVAATLDPSALAMAQTYREALRCEVLCAQVFEGKKSPMILGQPEQWLALLIESLLVSGQGRAKDADELRSRAFDEAKESQGTIDGSPFAWIADADSRLGPVLEAIINGRYYWVPFARLTKLTIEPPVDLRDLVWMPAHFEFANGGESVALIPARYAGSEKSGDAQILLARKTVWEEVSPDTYRGLGQRVFATDSGEAPLMNTREISFDSAPPMAESASG